MLVKEVSGVWTVPLPTTAPYTHVRLKRRHPDSQDYSVMIVDVNKLLMLHDRDHEMRIQNPEFWTEEKQKEIKRFLDPDDLGEAEMPIVSIFDAPMPGWWARFRGHSHEAVAFTNGRHRARFLRYMGAISIPVEVTERSKARLSQLCAIGH